ncbi:MAG: hypothetical protein E4H03_07330 [Myxococcales bacterium]|nr:MAG: hypothetical protein E4H03_07330 [Myxococcales bacterium]
MTVAGGRLLDEIAAASREAADKGRVADHIAALDRRLAGCGAERTRAFRFSRSVGGTLRM